MFIAGRDEISSCNVGVAMDTVGAVTETVYYVFYTCFKGTLGHTLDLSIARLFTGSKVRLLYDYNCYCADKRVMQEAKDKVATYLTI